MFEKELQGSFELSLTRAYTLKSIAIPSAKRCYEDKLIVGKYTDPMCEGMLWQGKLILTRHLEWLQTNEGKLLGYEREWAGQRMLQGTTSWKQNGI